MHFMQLVSGSEAMNGAMVHCVQLTRRLVERGHQITFVCTPNSAAREYVKDLPIEIIDSDQHRWPSDQLRRVAAIVRERNIDCMHAHLSRAQFFAVLLKQLTGVPCVATAHCPNFKVHRMFNDFVIANSESNRRIQMRKNLVRAQRIETVNYPVDLIQCELPTSDQRRVVRRSLGADDDTPLIGLVGNICHRKGQDTLLRALPMLLNKHSRLRAALIGNPFEGYADQMKKLADQLGVNHAVQWAGFRNDIPQVMAALDLCVAPSRSEAFGLTAVEALAVGTPVVVSRVGGLPETVEHEQTGLHIPPNNPRALAAAIDRMLTDSELYNRCKQTGRQSMLQRYDPERCWTRIEEILCQVASRRTPVRQAA